MGVFSRASVAFDLGFERAGWETRWQVEIKPFCRKVLTTRFPKAKRYDDIRECGASNLEPVECITAGVPCQDVSVAGKRAGLAGERTGLFYELARILRELRPAWFVFENVPGLFSSNRGRDFAEVLRVLMVECGYGVCWRVLDSQFFGVAQRRRRVFLVGRLGKLCPGEVLFESASRAGNFAKGGEKRTRASRRADGSLAGACAARDWKGADNIYAEEGKLVPTMCGEGDQHKGFRNGEGLVAASLRSADGHHGHSSPRGDGYDNIVTALQHLRRGGADDNEAQGGHIVIQDVCGHRDKKQHGIGISEGGPSYTLSETERHAVAFQWRRDPGGIGHFPVSAPPDADGMRDFAGLPEGLDGARYRALGNAVTVQVAEWIARRILDLSEQRSPTRAV